jgi:hypothetical protein
MSNDESTRTKILVIVDAPDTLPDVHIDSCERIAGFAPVIQPRPSAQSSGYVAHLDEIRERFPSVLWCECMDEVISRGIPWAAENIAPFTDGAKHLVTLQAMGVSVDVYYEFDMESYLFAVDGRIGARLTFDAIRDYDGRAEVFAERAKQAIWAILWADQDWQNRKPRPELYR